MPFIDAANEHCQPKFLFLNEHARSNESCPQVADDVKRGRQNRVAYCHGVSLTPRRRSRWNQASNYLVDLAFSFCDMQVMPRSFILLVIVLTSWSPLRADSFGNGAPLRSPWRFRVGNFASATRLEDTTNSTATISKEEVLPAKDFSAEASALFGNVRIPAALFAGASAGSAYALPISAGHEGVRIGFAKRLYALLMIHSLSANIIVIIVATASMAGIANQSIARESTSVVQWMHTYFNGEWVTVQCQFISGICTFALAVALRSWISMVCPVLANACVGILISSTLLALAFVDHMEKSAGRGTLLRLPIQQVHNLIRYSRTSPFFIAATLSYITTMVYMALRVPHLLHYLASAP